MKAFGELLLLLAKLAQSVMAKIKTAQRQKTSAQIDADPVAWANDHFSSGVRDKDDADKAAEADRDSIPRGPGKSLDAER